VGILGLIICFRGVDTVSTDYSICLLAVLGRPPNKGSKNLYIWRIALMVIGPHNNGVVGFINRSVLYRSSLRTEITKITILSPKVSILPVVTAS
jgi:hypothetical protein